MRKRFFNNNKAANENAAPPSMLELKKAVNEGFDRETLLKLMQMKEPKSYAVEKTQPTSDR